MSEGPDNHRIRFRDIGIADGFTHRSLLIDPVGRFTVAQFTDQSSPHHGGFWVKGFAEDIYRPLCGAVPDDDNNRSGAIDADGGTLYVNVFTLRRGTKDANGKDVTGWDWSRLDSYDLASGTRLSSLTTLDISGGERRIWISELWGATQQPGHVTATIAIEHPEVLGRTDITYHICDLDVATGRGLILTDLRATFV